MAIKEIPINYRVYFKEMREETNKSKDALIGIRDNLRKKAIVTHSEILSRIKDIESEYKINLLDYKEFVQNEYINGTFLRIAKGLLTNKSNNYELVGDLFNIYDLAKDQKTLKEYDDKINLYNKILTLSLSEYNNILKVFYKELHRKLIEGYGYSFEGYLGIICINRCKIGKTRRKRVDWNKTKLRKEELKSKGIRIYKKEEAEWCEKNGIEYDGVDGRVFMNKEYYYEVPLLYSKLPGGKDLELELTNYRGREIRHLKEADILDLVGSDINKVIELPLDLKTKINYCDKIDKTLYTKFIRNENQFPYYIKSSNRKNRQ